MNALALSLTPSISSNETFLIKGLLWRKGGPQRANENKHGEGSGQAYLYAYSVKKIARFFKQQIEFPLISCLVVAESFIKKA